MTTRCITCSTRMRASARCCVAGVKTLMWRHCRAWIFRPCRGEQAQALMLLLAKLPRDAERRRQRQRAA